MKKTTLVWGALVLLTGSALAQSTPAPASSPAKAALVQKAVQLQQASIESFARTVVVEQPVGQMMQAAGRALQAQPADKREAIGRAIEADVKKYVDEVGPIVRKKAMDLGPKTLGPVLDEKMSEDELKTLVAWLESPVSRKYNLIQPDLQRALGEALVTESRPTIEPKLKALEQSMAQRLGMSGNAPAGGASGSKAPAKK